MGAEETTGQEPVEAPEAQAAEGSKQETFDAAYVKQLRDEAASWRRKAKDLEGKVTGFETEKLTEAERLKAEMAAAKAAAKEAQEALRKARVDALIGKAATKHQIDPELLSKLVTVEFGDDGQPAEIDTAVTALLKSHPYLQAGGVSLNTTNPQRKGALTLDDVRKMTPQQIIARMDEVDEAARRGR